MTCNYKHFFILSWYIVLSMNCAALGICKAVNVCCPLQSKNTYCGARYFGAEHLGTIEILGATELDGTNVEHLTVYGNLQAQKAIIGTLMVNGSVYLENSVVQYEAMIQGFLEASTTTFNKIIIASTEVIFRATTIKDIIVRNNQGSGISRVKLNNGSHITGSVTFESGDGEILLSADSSVSGRVKGGRIIRK